MLVGGRSLLAHRLGDGRRGHWMGYLSWVVGRNGGDARAHVDGKLALITVSIGHIRPMELTSPYGAKINRVGVSTLPSRLLRSTPAPSLNGVTVHKPLPEMERFHEVWVLHGVTKSPVTTSVDRECRWSECETLWRLRAYLSPRVCRGV